MNRRSFLRTTGAVAGATALLEVPTQAAAGVLHSGSAASTGAEMRATVFDFQSHGSRDRITSTLAPWAPKAGEWNTHTIGHLYRRAGFGATMAEIVAAQALKPSDLIAALLDDKWTQPANMPAQQSHSADWLTVPPYRYGANTTQEQLDYAYALYEMRYWWASQMTQPNTMMRERMVYFWANHFVIEQQKVYYPQAIYHYFEYLRLHPWGNFKQMVKDITILPAMLYYLDGASSLRTAPNENYARELMELFTLGPVDKDGNPNYSEVDIHEVAKALTGYTVDYQSASPPLATKYDVNNHDSTFKQPFASAGAPKKQYGLASSGVVNDDIIDALFQYKGDKLADYICSKLYQQFVYKDTSGTAAQAVIAQMAQTFQSGNWELKPVLLQLLNSEHFFDDANIGDEMKSPSDYIAGLLRQFDVPATNLTMGSLYYYGAAMNQSLLDPPNVKGWPGGRSWISTSTLAPRAALATLLLSKGMVPAGGYSVYGETNTAITWTDANVLAWASQFPDYKGKLSAFIDQVATFLCAQKPEAQLLTAAVFAPLATTDAQWPTVTDAVRTKNIRTIVTTIALMPEFQMM